MAIINPVLQLPTKIDPELARALKAAWLDMTKQVNNLLTVYQQSTRPLIPDGAMSLWVDTVNNKYYLVANFGQGNIKKVELT